MAEQIYTKSRGTSPVSWIALVVSIIALIIGWMAYNRTGENLEDQIQTQIDQSMNAAQDAANEAGDALDAGPDGVDEDDTDVPPSSNPATDAPAQDTMIQR